MKLLKWQSLKMTVSQSSWACGKWAMLDVFNVDVGGADTLTRRYCLALFSYRGSLHSSYESNHKHCHRNRRLVYEGKAGNLLHQRQRYPLEPGHMF